MKRLYKRAPQPLAVPEAANATWSADFMSDALWDSPPCRTFNWIDDFNREAPAIEIDLKLPATRVVRVLKRVAACRGYPSRLRWTLGLNLWRQRWQTGPERVALNWSSYYSAVRCRTTSSGNSTGATAEMGCRRYSGIGLIPVMGRRVIPYFLVKWSVDKESISIFTAQFTNNPLPPKGRQLCCTAESTRVLSGRSWRQPPGCYVSANSVGRQERRTAGSRRTQRSTRLHAGKPHLTAVTRDLSRISPSVEPGPRVSRRLTRSRLFPLVGEDLRDQRWVFHAGDNQDGHAALLTGSDLVVENTLGPPCTCHRAPTLGM